MENSMRSSVRALALVVVFGLLTFSLSGCERSAPPEQHADASTAPLAVTGAGSSFAAPIFEHWIKVYGSEHPELALSYASVGSGEGTQRFLAGTVDIGATDTPLRAEEAYRVEGGFVQIPVTAGMIAIACNLAVIITDPAGAHSYPIVTYTWALLRGRYEVPAKAEAIDSMIRWALTEGQTHVEPLGYVPLPSNVVQASLAELDQAGS
jgi:ABC-type phosphate transport system substrate-binding protein